MATKPYPYRDRVDEFIADYSDKFAPTLVTGKPNQETGGAIPMTKEQLDLEKTKILASSISPETFSKVLDTMRGEKPIPSHRVEPGTPASQFSNSPEGQRIMRERAIPIPHVSTGFTPPTGGGTLEEIKAAIPNELLRGAGLGAAMEMTPNKEGVYERAIPTLESVWGIKREGDRFTLPGGEGTMTLGPENVLGDRLARERIMAESGGAGTPIPQQGWWVTSPGGGRYWETPQENARARAISEQMYGGGGGGFGIPTDVSKALADVQKILMTPTARPWSPQGYLGKEGGYSKTRINAIQDYADTLKGLAIGQMGAQTRMRELEAERPYKEAMADYYRRMAGVHEAAIPMESFEKYARGTAALRESERPYAFPPNSAVYQGAKLLGYVPEKPEAIHPIIRDVINKSMMIDPATGQQTGFDIRGARQKIGFMAPWLKAQGIDVPKESYKMTKPEFMSEHKSWVEKQPKKDRKKYNTQYMEQLWKEYWGD